MMTSPSTPLPVPVPPLRYRLPPFAPFVTPPSPPWMTSWPPAPAPLPVEPLMVSVSPVVLAAVCVAPIIVAALPEVPTVVVLARRDIEPADLPMLTFTAFVAPMLRVVASAVSRVGERTAVSTRVVPSIQILAAT